MSSLYTAVEGANFLTVGVATRAEAIAEARSVAQYESARWQAVCARLAAPDDQLRVTVVRGAITEIFVRELT